MIKLPVEQINESSPYKIKLLKDGSAFFTTDSGLFKIEEALQLHILPKMVEMVWITRPSMNMAGGIPEKAFPDSWIKEDGC